MNGKDQEFEDAESSWRARGRVCKECGSPLSDRSEFCWTCGANAHDEQNPHVNPAIGLPQMEPTGPVRDGNPNPSLTPHPDSQPYWPDAFEFSSPPATGQSTTQQAPAPFEFPYRPDSIPDPHDEQAGNIARYRVIAVVFLVALVITAGYWRREEVKAFYLTFRNMAAEQFSFLRESKAEDDVPLPSASPVVQARVRQYGRLHARPEDAKNAQPEVSKPDSLPLGVRIQGKAAPPVVTKAVYGHRSAVEVGTSAPWMTSALLSPVAIQVSPRESLARLIKRVPPVYPEAARAASIEGTVVLKVVIRKDGSVGKLTTLSGDPLLIPAAVDSVRQWVYSPYYLYGVAMEVETIVAVDFLTVSQAAAETSAPK